MDDAIACYRQALKINPRSADACANLGVAFFQRGQTKEAIDFWQQALEIKPDQVYVQNNLAWALATTSDASLRNGAKAVALAKQASESGRDRDPVILRTLAAAYAETAQFSEAITTVRRAMQLATEQKNNTLATALQKELELYEEGHAAARGSACGVTMRMTVVIDGRYSTGQVMREMPAESFSPAPVSRLHRGV